MIREDQAARAADIVLRAFEDFHEVFRTITRRARQRFERRDWDGIRRDTVKRLDEHERAVSSAVEMLGSRLGERVGRARWSAVKRAFTAEILGRDDAEIAQTFFNSVTRRVCPHVGVDPAVDYVSSDFPVPFKGWEMASARLYAVRQVDAAAIVKVLRDTGLEARFRDLPGDAEAVAARLRGRLVDMDGGPEIEAIDVLRPVFIRNKAAYVVGRARGRRASVPIILVLLHEDDGLVVDAVLDSEDEASVVFSFARWYFHADLASPRHAIGFLHALMPKKHVGELYISLGYHKHAKTELFGDLVQHIASTSERFVPAPGTPGLVMAVFTLPSYPFVFKVIKDVFPATKQTTRDQIRRRYREVLRHDRVGRLVDFQTFEDLAFPRARFSPELLEQLCAEAGQTVRLVGDSVEIAHLYVGRRVTPLDLYLPRASRAQAAAATLEWGRALKDLAAANIFAGDILRKNFGITRHGRVVFYDYDELRSLDQCRFRRFPEPREPWQELAAEPWFTVGEDDVFPEEFPRFLELDEELLALFTAHHGELFDVAFWRAAQARNRAGELIDFFPYGAARRLHP